MYRQRDAAKRRAPAVCRWTIKMNTRIRQLAAMLSLISTWVLSAHTNSEWIATATFDLETRSARALDVLMHMQEKSKSLDPSSIGITVLYQSNSENITIPLSTENWQRLYQLIPIDYGVQKDQDMPTITATEPLCTIHRCLEILKQKTGLDHSWSNHTVTVRYTTQEEVQHAPPVHPRSGEH